MKDDKQSQEDKTLSEDEVKEQIIEEYDFDPDVDGDRIEKAVKREMALRKDSKSAIGQKITKRDKLARRDGMLKKLGYDKHGKKLKKSDDDKNKNKNKGKKGKETPEEMEKRITANIMGGIALEKLGLDDEVEKELKDFAAFKKITIVEAMKTPFGKSLIKDFQDEVEENDASSGNKRKGKGSNNYEKGKSVDFRKITPAEAAKNLPDKTYQEYKKWSNDNKSVKPVQKIEK